MNKLLNVIKQASQQTNEESKPSGLYFGEVVSTSPLSIMVEQRLTLTEEFLVLTSAVRDYELDVAMDHITTSYTHSHTCPDGSTSSNTHNHKLIGKKKIKIHNALEVGEQVILLRVQGGQSYLVLDRVDDPNCKGE